jgi:hypothetical protein
MTRDRLQEQGQEPQREGPLSRELFAAVTEVRLRRPHTAEEQAAKRLRPDIEVLDGKLTLLAADQPARQEIAVAGDPLALGDRYSYLSRIVLALTTAGIDGVVGTTDVIEDLLILCHLMEQRGEPPLLDQKLLVASMNPGGVAGSVFEIEAPFTSFVPQTVAALRLDGAKLTLRIAAGEPRSAGAIAACAVAITELNALGLTVFLEAALLRKADGRWRTLREAADLVKLVGLASALGDSSLRLWLAVPYCDDFAAVSAATTLPLLVSAGGEAGEAATAVAEVEAAMRAGANVRGALLAANVLFLDGGLETAAAVSRAVHG